MTVFDLESKALLLIVHLFHATTPTKAQFTGPQAAFGHYNISGHSQALLLSTTSRQQLTASPSHKHLFHASIIKSNSWTSPCPPPPSPSSPPNNNRLVVAH